MLALHNLRPMSAWPRRTNCRRLSANPLSCAVYSCLRRLLRNQSWPPDSQPLPDLAYKDITHHSPFLSGLTFSHPYLFLPYPHSSVSPTHLGICLFEYRSGCTSKTPSVKPWRTGTCLCDLKTSYGECRRDFQRRVLISSTALARNWRKTLCAPVRSRLSTSPTYSRSTPLFRQSSCHTGSWNTVLTAKGDRSNKQKKKTLGPGMIVV